MTQITIEEATQNLYKLLEQVAKGEQFILMKEGKEVYLVDLQDKDPADMGFSNFTHLIQETYPLTFSDLLEKKLQLI